MTKKSLIPVGILVVAIAAIVLNPLFAEYENPNQKGLEQVSGGAPSRTVRADIVPLIWRATIDDAVVSVPLRSVEYYGVQIYDTDSQTRVHELTICTESQSFVRIYYILPLGSANERAGQKVERLREIAQGASRQDWVYPIKNIRPRLIPIWLNTVFPRKKTCSSYSKISKRRWSSITLATLFPISGMQPFEKSI